MTSVYQWLTSTYQPGDRISLFGFSRGAFTVRSLAGLIAACGLIDTSGLEELAIRHAIKGMYEGKYRRRGNPGPRWLDGLVFRFYPGDAAEIPVQFIGVWDTVGALGIPDHLAVLNLLDSPRRHAFHDLTLNPHVRYARHAVAMDERRGTFAPTLWDSAPAPKQDLKQVWFPGSHMDVGGGHRETGLSNGALEWMIEEARGTAKLAFHKTTVDQIRPDPLDVLHDDDRGLSAPALAPVLEPLLEPVVDIVFEPRPRAVPLIDPHAPSPSIDKSVYDRYQSPPITSGPYRPTRSLAPGESTTVEVSAGKPWNETGLYLKVGDYRFTTKGEWLDAGIPSSPAGITGLRRFNPAVEKARLVGTLIGQGE
ncbi:MAG: DUF2235 domain-containing protein, partial [Actinobacteria bacterium]|nr:DUF2235 domain-containing protein [Actinomycetota bacterium]